MNKDLPVIIRKVFSNLDPLIWQGVWLYTLEMLLNDPRMFGVWDEFVAVLKNKHLKGSNLKLNQYMKWELKAFVAQAVSLVNKNYNEELFIHEFEKFFLTKVLASNKESICVHYVILELEKI